MVLPMHATTYNLPCLCPSPSQLLDPPLTHAKDMPLINIHVQTIRHAFMHPCGIMLCMGVLFKFGKVQLHICDPVYEKGSYRPNFGN